MARRIKNLLIVVLFLSLLPLFTYAVQERTLEVNYPSLPGSIQPPTVVKTVLTDYIRYLYRLTIVLSGFFILIAIVRSGLKMIISSSKPGIRVEAKKDLQNVFFGISIIFFAFIILKTINPRIITTSPKVRNLEGVTLCAVGEVCFTTTKSIANLEEKIGFRPTSLYFNSNAEILDVSLFPLANYGGEETIFSGRERQVQFPSMNSIQLRWELPGVYICNADYLQRGDSLVCPGKEERVSQTLDLLPSFIQGKLEGIKIKKFKQKGIEQDYALIFHSEVDEKGEAEVFNPLRLTPQDSSEFLKKLNSKNPFLDRQPIFDLKNTKSLTVFIPTKTAFGNGVYFCEEVDPDLNTLPNCRGPYQEIKGNLGSEVNDLKTGESLELIPNAQECSASFFGNNKGVSSLVIDGNYLVVVFDQNDFQGNAEVFTKTDLNLTNNYIGECCLGKEGGKRNDCASSVIVMPIDNITKINSLILPTSLPTCKDQCDLNYVECQSTEDQNSVHWGYKKCGDFDADYCLDWPKKFIDCPEGYKCVENPKDPCVPQK